MKDNDVQLPGGKLRCVLQHSSIRRGDIEPRFGIVRGDSIVDVVAAADALQRAVPATTVKAALTTGAHTLQALEELVQAAERGKLARPVAG